MAEDYLRQSALAHLHLARRGESGAAKDGVVLSEMPLRSQLVLRGLIADGALSDAIKGALGVEPPKTPNTVATVRGTSILWLGPDEWLISGASATARKKLEAGLAKQHAGLTDIGDSRTVIGLSGPRARDLLMKGCTLDLHPRAFGPGQCAQTLLAKAGVLLHQTGDEPAYEITVLRSFAEYLWLWLEDAAAEFGFAVEQP